MRGVSRVMNMELKCIVIVSVLVKAGLKILIKMAVKVDVTLIL